VLVGEEKLVSKLGTRGSLPVEVVPFAVPLAFKRISALGLKPRVRPSNGGDYITDNGNLILDCAVREIHNPARLDSDLLAVPGVVGTGLFVGLATTVLIARANGKVQTLRRKP
jgi:ribose 5-phosphate isomerase A